MAVNKKGQMIFVSIMIAIMVFIVALIIAFPLKDEINRARNSSKYLNSSDTNLAIEHQATTIVLDLTLFYYIGIVIAASLAYVTGKKSVTGAITAIMMFIVVSVLISPLKELIILLRDSAHLDCTNTAITVGGKLACIVVDIWLFYFVVAAIAAAVSLIFITKALPIIKGEG